MLNNNELQLDNHLLKRGRMIFRAINHPLRQQMIQVIHDKGNITVTDLYVRLKLEQSVASQHLAILRKEQFVTTKREGKCIYYSVNYDRINEIQEVSRKMFA